MRFSSRVKNQCQGVVSVIFRLGHSTHCLINFNICSVIFLMWNTLFVIGSNTCIVLIISRTISDYFVSIFAHFHVNIIRSNICFLLIFVFNEMRFVLTLSIIRWTSFDILWKNRIHQIMKVVIKLKTSDTFWRNVPRWKARDNYWW